MRPQKFKIVDSLGTVYGFVQNMVEAWSLLQYTEYNGSSRYRYVANTDFELTLQDRMFSKRVVFKLIEV